MRRPAERNLIMIEEKFDYVATYDEIQMNDFNLNIPWYVDTFEEEAEVDIAAMQQEIEDLDGELKDIQTEMNKNHAFAC